MAIVIRKDPESANLGPLKIRSYEIDLDNSYPTGGEAIDLSAEFDVIKGAVFESKAGYQFELTSKDAPASSKIKVYTPAGTLKVQHLAGAAAGNRSAPGAAVGDKIIKALVLNAVKDVTSNTQQFASVISKTASWRIPAASTVSNTGGTAYSANDEVLVFFQKAALQEVSNAADLSGVTKVGLLVWGRKS